MKSKHAGLLRRLFTRGTARCGVALALLWQLALVLLPTPATLAVASAATATDQYSLWSATATPAVAAENDSSAVEVGVQFRPSANGYISGVRFYKGSGNGGTHVAHLWTSAGTKLATATFAGETATG
jgi:hypothetical protein